MKAHKHGNYRLNWEALDLCHLISAVTLGLKLHVNNFPKHFQMMGVTIRDCNLVSDGLENQNNKTNKVQLTLFRNDCAA